MFDEYKIIEIEESKFTEVKSLNNYNTIELSNDLGIKVDSRILCDYFENIEGNSEITRLRIIHTSQLSNVEVAKAFPNLKILRVSGNNIMTLEGLEYFKNGEYLALCMSKNKKRNIENISKSNIDRMDLYYQRKEDFDAIANCLTLKELEIAKGPNPNFYDWKKVPLEYLKLTQGKFTELGDMVYIKSLNTLMVGDCRRLERFTGDNSSVRSIIIVTCNKLDLSSLNTFKNLERILANTCAKEVNLSEFTKLKKLKYLTLLNCKVNIDTYDLKANMPNLIDITLDKMSNEQALMMSEVNLNVAVFGRSKEFLNGKIVDS